MFVICDKVNKGGCMNIPFEYRKIRKDMWDILYGGINLGRVQKIDKQFYAIRAKERPQQFSNRETAAKFLKIHYWVSGKAPLL